MKKGGANVSDGQYANCRNSLEWFRGSVENGCLTKEEQLESAIRLIKNGVPLRDLEKWLPREER